MPLDSFALEAFQAIAQHGTFTSAARRLHITQSALSQRISGLERELGTTLFLRQKQGAELTAAGHRLLRFVQAKGHLEEELLGELKTAGAQLEGTVRVTGFSSVVSSVLIPALAPLLRQSSTLRLELLSREVEEIPGCLLRGETDFAVSFSDIHREGVRSELLGEEHYVLAEARKGKVPEVFLDHHEDDEISILYLRRFEPGKPSRILRRYLDDSYGLLEGVACGMGRAILPRHLLSGDARVRVLHPERVLRVPVHLSYLDLPYYTRLHNEVLEAIRAGFREKLSPSRRG